VGTADQPTPQQAHDLRVRRFSFLLNEFLNSYKIQIGVCFANSNWLPPKKNLKLSAVRLRRLFEFSRGDFLAPFGGEMRSD